MSSFEAKIALADSCPLQGHGPHAIKLALDTWTSKYAEEARDDSCMCRRPYRCACAKCVQSQRNANFVAIATLGICYIAELYLNRCESPLIRSEYEAGSARSPLDLPASAINSGYLAIFGYLAMAATRTDLAATVLPAAHTDSTARAQVASLGTIIAIPCSAIFSIFSSGAANPPEAVSGEASSILIPTASLLAIALLVVDSMLSESAGSRIPKIRSFKLLYPVACLTSIFIGSTAFERTVNVADCAVIVVMYLGEFIAFGKCAYLLRPHP